MIFQDLLLFYNVMFILEECFFFKKLFMCIGATHLITEFTISGRPFSLQNCTISNQSSDSLQVECVEGFDGGLAQAFILELIEISELRLVRNLSLVVRESLMVCVMKIDCKHFFLIYSIRR